MRYGTSVPYGMALSLFVWNVCSWLSSLEGGAPAIFISRAYTLLFHHPAKSSNMDSTNGPGKRGSALPRTKLPTPGSGIPKAPTALKSSPAATSSHGRAQSQAGFAIPQRPLQHNVQAPLTSHAKPPTTSAQAEPGKHERQTSATSTASSRSQYTRHNSLQSDQTGDGPSSEESEITPDTPLSPASNGGSLKLPRRPRPSLSDRAIESLGNISPSPINERR